MLYRYGLNLGLRLLFHKKFKESINYLIIPVNYWRYTEYKLVFEEAEFRDIDKILDIGSPKLLSIYIAEKTGAEIFSTDIEDYFVQEYDLIREIKSISPQKFHIRIEDGRKLTFESNYFTKVYSISVIEHIPEDGDMQCAREIGRVLKKGGRCILTVPFSPIPKVDYKEDNFYWAKSSKILESGKVFYGRRYDEEQLLKRIIIPSGLKLRKIKYVGERVLTKFNKELCDFLPSITGPVQPLLSKLFHSEPVDDWRYLKKPLCALIVLEK